MKLNCFLCTVAFATIAMPALAQNLAGNQPVAAEALRVKPNVIDCTLEANKEDDRCDCNAEANKEDDRCLGLPLANGAPLNYQSVAGPVIGGLGVAALLGAAGGGGGGTTSTGSTGTTGTN